MFAGAERHLLNRKPNTEPLNLKSVSGVFICLQGSGSWVSGQHAKRAGQRDKDLRRPRKDATKTVPVRGKGLDRARKPRYVFLPFAACSKGKAARQAGRGPPHCWRETRGRQTGQSMATLVTTAPGRQAKREGGVDCFFFDKEFAARVGNKTQNDTQGQRDPDRAGKSEKDPKREPGGGKETGQAGREKTQGQNQAGKSPNPGGKKTKPQEPETLIFTHTKIRIPGVKPQFPEFFEFEFRVFWVRVLGFKVSGPLRAWDLECRLTGFGIWGGVWGLGYLGFIGSFRGLECRVWCSLGFRSFEVVFSFRFL